MQILKQSTTLIAIYRRNSYPLLQLRFKKNIESLREEYEFEKVDFPFDLSSDPKLPLFFRLNNGYYREHYILNLTFDDRKINLSIQSDSNTAESLLSEIESFISSLSFGPIERVVKTVRTELFVKLEINLAKVYSDKVIELAKLIKEKDNYIDEISPFGITFKIKYTTPNEMWDENAYFSDKYFRLERELSTKNEENRFFSVLPLNTNEHISLLKKIEKLFS